MFALIAANWFVFLLAFLIGVATAWWVWARYTAEVAAPRVSVAPPKAVPAPPVVVTSPAPPVAAAPLMATPKPAVKKAAPKPKAAPVKKVAVKPAVKPVTLKAAPAKPAVKKVAAPKVAAPKVVEAKAPAKVAPKPKAAAKPKATTKPKAAPKPIIPDNLELLKGVGPKLNALLKSLGVTSFEQVANWTAPDIAEIDSKLGNFAGRIGRDNWIDQAKLLTKGDIAGFEKKYGSLGSEINKG
jgi:predicted flap endonuclease-1-like 5' DNA nuclease